MCAVCAVQAINGAVVANKLSNAELILTLMTGETCSGSVTTVYHNTLRDCSFRLTNIICLFWCNYVGNADKSRAVHRQWEELVGVWQETCRNYVKDSFRYSQAFGPPSIHQPVRLPA